MAHLVRRYNPSVRIVCTLERIVGTCDISDIHGTCPDGSFQIEWCGRTEVDWNSQETQEREGQRIFLDENGEEVLENDCMLVDDATASIADRIEGEQAVPSRRNPHPGA